MTKLHETLSYPLRWMRAERAALYLDISRSKFLELVDCGTLPHPVSIEGIKVWDRGDLDATMERHKQVPESSGDEPSSFDSVIKLAHRKTSE